MKPKEFKSLLKSFEDHNSRIGTEKIPIGPVQPVKTSRNENEAWRHISDGVLRECRLLLVFGTLIFHFFHRKNVTEYFWYHVIIIWEATGGGRVSIKCLCGCPEHVENRSGRLCVHVQGGIYLFGALKSGDFSRRDRFLNQHLRENRETLNSLHPRNWTLDELSKIPFSPIPRDSRDSKHFTIRSENPRNQIYRQVLASTRFMEANPIECP